MLILHGSFLSETDGRQSRFAVWGESLEQPPEPHEDRSTRRPPRSEFRAGDSRSYAARRTLRSKARVPKSAPRARPHPFAASQDDLMEAIGGWVPGMDREDLLVLAQLPTIADRPCPSRELMSESGAPDSHPHLDLWRVPAIGIAPPDALALLLRMPSQDDRGPAASIGSDMIFWRAAARLVFEFLTAGRFKPDLVTGGDSVRAVWRPLLESAEDNDRFHKLVAAMPAVARALSREPAQLQLSPNALLREFIGSALDGFVRRSTGKSLKRARKQASPGQSLVAALSSDISSIEAASDFIDQFRKWSQPADQYRGGNARICFRLQPPPKSSAAAGQIVAPGSQSWSLDYLLQAEDDPSLLVPARTVWKERGSDLKFLNRKFEHPQERLLAGLGAAERVFPPIGSSLRQARPELCSLTPDQAYSFIKEASVLLTSTGFGVLLPGIGRKLTTKLRLSPGRQAKTSRKSQSSAKGSLSLSRLVDFDWEVAIGGHTLTRAEFEKLVKLKMPLVQIRGEWVELNPDDLQRALDYWKKMESGPAIGLAQALDLALGPEATPGLPVSDIEASGWVGEVLEKLKGESSIQQLKAPPEFEGKLRHYQRSGFSWLAFLREFGLGACLADDMGLGKTIQAIALLLDLRSKGTDRPALLICPTSVVANWHRELGRFAPSLRVLIHHGTRRQKADFSTVAAGHDVVVSSYSLLHRDEQH